MNREQTSDMIGLLSDRHVAAAARYAPGDGTLARKSISDKKPRHVRGPVLIAAAAVLAIALGITAYAADLVGFRRTVDLWFHAERQQAELWDTDSESKFALVFPDGEKLIISGGKGSQDGTTLPMSAQENLELLENNFDIQRDRDGRIWFCYRDERRDITDQFDENGTTVLTWQKDGKTFSYFAAIKGDGFELSLLDTLEKIIATPEEDLPQP